MGAFVLYKVIASKKNAYPNIINSLIIIKELFKSNFNDLKKLYKIFFEVTLLIELDESDLFIL
ncbi:hypothetical protein ULVI_02620 [Cochleicola gelatinilyticus]|uniref:Uncharacterized protein n=1 Tax=Cochleicola gelatinilyticus TaxID=1763537 RepID=A0A167IHM8_9FLAO|nr:hypothetical protein ULVI_02620 [Cochleicola gelatinilyticus]